ncbi:MAG: hypothetical protein IPG88_19795 [Gemmatimonadetes bacterium]|nr:hypothetical protein [Gemmatimonadota bacterium]
MTGQQSSISVAARGERSGASLTGAHEAHVGREVERRHLGTAFEAGESLGVRHAHAATRGDIDDHFGTAITNQAHQLLPVVRSPGRLRWIVGITRVHVNHGGAGAVRRIHGVGDFLSRFRDGGIHFLALHTTVHRTADDHRRQALTHAIEIGERVGVAKGGVRCRGHRAFR